MSGGTVAERPWLDRSLAVVAGAVVTAALYRSAGTTLAFDALAGLVVALAATSAVRWCRGTVALVRRAGEGRKCGRCGASARRRPGRLLARCPACGWHPGLPGLRLLTRSVLARRLRPRRWLWLGTLAVAGALALGATVGTGHPVVDREATAVAARVAALL